MEWTYIAEAKLEQHSNCLPRDHFLYQEAVGRNAPEGAFLGPIEQVLSWELSHVARAYESQGTDGIRR